MASSRKGAPEPGLRTGAHPDASHEPPLGEGVATCLRQHLAAGGSLVVGYSGGLDSTVLLHLLADLRGRIDFSLSALHVHHGLSKQADAWAVHCQRTCATLGVPLRVARVDVTRAGDGPEAAARAARYREFTRLDADCLALAHHRDDQAETVLLQLLRGGGPKGLAAMPMARRLGREGPHLLRPLLEVPRAALETWARARGLVWIEDESNRHSHLTRNALRHEILPLIAARFPDAHKVLAQEAGRFAEVARLLDDLADLDGQGAGMQEGLEVSRLAALPEARARNLLRRHLGGTGAVISPDSLREGLRQILSARPDAQVELAFGRVVLRRYRGCLYTSLTPRGTGALPRPWQGEAGLDLGVAGTLHFQVAASGGVRLGPEPVSIRFRSGGERLRPDLQRPRRPLKDLLREAAIPPWHRKDLPLLYVGERLAWVATLGADAGFLAGAGEVGWHIVWVPAAATLPDWPDRPA